MKIYDTSVDKGLPPRDGSWYVIKPRQGSAAIRNRWGYPVRRIMYQGGIGRYDPETGRASFEYCNCRHLKRTAAQACALRQAKRLNRER